jgi:hypothetical protein
MELQRVINIENEPEPDYDDPKPPVQDKRNDDTKPPVQDKRNDGTKPPVQDKRNDGTKPPVQDDTTKVQYTNVDIKLNVHEGTLN